MNRKVLLIVGPGGDAYGEKEIVTFATKLAQLNVDFQLVGNGKQDLKMNEIIQALNTVSPEQDVTIIIQSHGKKRNGFQFCLGDDFLISSKLLFQMFKMKLGNKPIDIFTPSCYGELMLYDKEELPEGSTLVSLTSSEEGINSSNYISMLENFETFGGEVTAYNLLEFYLVYFLKNRFTPFIAISGQSTIYNLDNFLSSENARGINFDSEHFYNLVEPPRYLTVFEKIQNLKSQYDIDAVDYGLAMAICLNELKNRGLVNSSNQAISNDKTR